MRSAKYLGALFIAAVVLFLFAVNFSSSASSFVCNGTTASQQGPRPTTIYIKLEKYRWWVGLWSKSNGALHAEVPNTFIEYFEHIASVEDQLQIFDAERRLKGNFSYLSNTLVLSTPGGLFDGNCAAKQ